MCLATRNSQPQITYKDIVCYKWLERSKKGSLVSPFAKESYKLKELKLAKGDPSPFKSSAYPGLYLITEGYIHAYRQPLFMKYLYKAIIPKGSKYYIGEHGDICASRMIIVKPLKWYHILFYKIWNRVISR